MKNLFYCMQQNQYKFLHRYYFKNSIELVCIYQMNEMIFWLCKLRASTFVLFYYDLRVAFTSIQLLPFAYSNEEFAFGQRFIAAFCKWQVKLIYGTYTTLWNISHYFNASNIIISAFLHQNQTYCIVLVKYRYSIPRFQKY